MKRFMVINNLDTEMAKWNWVDELTDKPAFRLPYLKPQHLHHVGYLPWTSQYASECKKTIIDRNWEAYATRIGLKYNEEAFDVIRATFEGANNAVTKQYDLDPTRPPPGFDSEAWIWAEKAWLSLHSDMLRACKVLKCDEVKFPGDAAPGKEYKRLGCVDKAQAVQEQEKRIREFIRYSRIVNYPVLYNVSPKVEMLKMQKIKDNKPRAFLIQPVDALIDQLTLTQDFNKKLMLYGNMFNVSPTRNGMAMQNGGWTGFFNTLDIPFWKKIFSDVNMWDGKFWFWDTIKRIRYACWDRKDISEEEFKLRLDYGYQGVQYTYFVMPTGQVLLKEQSQPSGYQGTSADAAIAHGVITLYEWRVNTGKGLPEYLANVRCGVFGDDKAQAISPDYADKYTFENRSKVYATVGLPLAADKDVEGQEIEGGEFLGLKCVRMPNGRLAPIPRYRDKVFCSLRNLEGDLEIDVKFMRAIQILLMCSFDDELWSVVHGYILEMFKQYPDIETTIRWARKLPDREDVQSFWWGDECKFKEEIEELTRGGDFATLAEWLY